MKDLPRINPDDYCLPDGLTDDQVAERLADPLVRICNLYVIADKNGNEVRFRPNEAQCCVLHAIYVQGLRRITVPKARQLGISTLIAIILLDEATFREGIEGAIVDAAAADAEAKLAKCRFAWERLPKDLKDPLIPGGDSKGELRWANDSGITAGLRVRGKTPQVLHVSEWGPIAYNDPKRSEEIKTGALQAASGSNALIVTESTHKGGKSGDWFDHVEQALAVKPEHRTRNDFTVLFFPWWQEPGYTLAGDATQIDARTLDYFARTEAKIGRRLTDGQRLWYFKKKVELGRKIYSEYPSILEESWLAPHEGAIYAEQMGEALANGRIVDGLARAPDAPMFLTLDIGWDDFTTPLMWQVVGQSFYFLRMERFRHKTAAEVVQWVRETGMPVAMWLLPHDAFSGSAASNGLNYRDRLVQAGVPANAIIKIPKPVDIWPGIDAFRSIIARSYFHATACAQGIDDLNAYHTKKAGASGVLVDEPVHDAASHGADTFRMVAEAMVLGLVNTRAAARAARDIAPLFPDGSQVEVASEQQRRNRLTRLRRANSSFRLP